MRERSILAVPRTVLAALVAGVALQSGFRAANPSPEASAPELPAPPGATALRLASFGESVAIAKLLMLYVQGIDYSPGSPVPFRNLDYARLEAWLARILELDPHGQYPLLAASRIYAEVPEAPKQRQMLEFVYREFLVDPNRRWPWLAHATVLAKHRLHDLPLAVRYAEALERRATAEDVPLWARQMRAFILEDMDELEAARIVIGGYIQSGKVQDAGELRFLEQRLREIDARLAKKTGKALVGKPTKMS
jgi:hypothetical protein